MEHTVAIVGRPNVGKSALFNCLAGRDISLVFDRPGTTRDRMVTTARWDKHRFTLIDTGGIGVDDREGFGDAIAHEVELALAAATEIIFVVDAREGLTPLDLTVSRLLRKSQCPVFVAANKVDGDKQANLDGEFQRLGFKGVFPVSAAHRRGLDELREALVAGWGEAAKEDEQVVKPARPTRLAIVGRPNVGKSSLINAVAKRTATKTENKAGVTRQLRWIRVSPNLELMDTPGILVPKIPTPEAQWMLALTGALPRERYDPEDVVGRFAAWAQLHAPKLDVPDLERFARARGFVRRGDQIDAHNAAGAYLRAFNEGKFGRITFEEPPEAA